MNSNESFNSHARINTLVEKLRHQLKNFTVIDQQGERIGEVKDLTLDANRQLNLVVSQLANDINSHWFLLISKLIQKIDTPNKAVLVNINKAVVNSLPAYVNSGNSAEVAEFSMVSEMHNDQAINTSINSNSEQFDQAFEIDTQPSATSDKMVDMGKEMPESMATSSSNGEVLEEEIIRLLGERLVIERSKQKVGEVIVRKEIETRMIQVPVRHEKLIVERVGAEPEQLAEIHLGTEEISGVVAPSPITEPKTQTTSLNGVLTVSGEFSSPKTASLVLNAIAQERNHGCQRVRVEIVVKDIEQQKTYQQWFDRCSNKSL